MIITVPSFAGLDGCIETRIDENTRASPVRKRKRRGPCEAAPSSIIEGNPGLAVALVDARHFKYRQRPSVAFTLALWEATRVSTSLKWPETDVYRVVPSARSPLYYQAELFESLLIDSLRSMKSA